LAPLTAQPVSLQLEFSDKLLDDTKLKENLKFERDGQSLGTDNLLISKSTDKLYVVSGMDQAGNATGTYSITLDLSKLHKYNSGKEGVSTSKVQWSVISSNKAPIAYAGANQTVNENTLVTLDGSGSTDPDSDALTYLWAAPSGITLSSTTDSKPTFTAPEVDTDQTYTFDLVVNDGKVNSSVSQVTVTVKNVSPTRIQTISLNIGWNIISANVTPPNLNMMDIFQPLINEGKLKKVMDESGKTLEDFGFFGGWNNDIGTWGIDRGYKVNLTESTTLNLEGPPVSLPMEINLYAGWNIIGYPSDQQMDAMTIFQPLIDAGKLKKVMDEAGLSIEDFGVYGGWTNNIGNLTPNKGYKVNMVSDGTLTIPSSGTKVAVIPPENLDSKHFRKVFNGNGTDHMNINLIDLAKGGLKAGDEIGIFDGEICVGSVQIGSQQISLNYISIPASENDEMDHVSNGFTPQNPIKLRLFRNNQEYLLQPELVNNSNSIFAKGESMFARVNTGLATAIIEPTEPVSVKCYPNPFTNRITVEIVISEAQKLDVKIFDLSGQIIRTLYRGNGKEKTVLVWDGKNDQGVRTVPGSYLLKANNTVEKIVLSH